MKIQINKRIDLQPIIKHIDWKDTYITVRTLNVDDIRKFSKEQKKVQRDQEKVQKDYEKYKKLLEKNSDDASLSEHVQQLETAVDEQEYALFDYFTSFIQENFVSGMAYNSETGKVEALQAEDISQFNMGVLQAIIEGMMGGEKKS
jgi:hypothetical protein